MLVHDIKSIRELYKTLKRERVVLTYEEFSERIGYHKTYISRVLNGHEELTQEIIQRINSFDFYGSKNVPREMQGVRPLYSLEEMKKKNEEQWELIKSQQNTIHLLTSERFLPPEENQKRKNA